MAQTTQINFRIDEDIKKNAENILNPPCTVEGISSFLIKRVLIISSTIVRVILSRYVLSNWELMFRRSARYSVTHPCQLR